MTEQPPLRPTEEELWAGPMGERWLASVDRLERMLEPVGAALMEKAAFAPGEQVVDFGCGAGATSVEIARRVAPGGAVTGLDISPVLVETGRQRAAAASLDNLSFVLGDASKTDLGRVAHDHLFSRFGNMFFHDPYAAFANLHGFLKPTGRLTLACWAPPAQNAWIAEIGAIIARYVEVPPQPPRAPGPFVFGDTAYLGDVLAAAGFTSAAFDLWRGPQMIGGPGSDPIAATEFLLDRMRMGDALADAPEAVRTAARDDITGLLTRHHTPDGVCMEAAAWIVTARA
jgi:SAM-dependent methyltransferase